MAAAAVLPRRAEGWTWLWNAPKWHYFRDGRSLCGRWGLWGPGEFEPDTGRYDRDHCRTCTKKLVAHPPSE